jgi:hypothetical protein
MVCSGGIRIETAEIQTKTGGISIRRILLQVYTENLALWVELVRNLMAHGDAREGK